MAMAELQARCSSLAAENGKLRRVELDRVAADSWSAPWDTFPSGSACTVALAPRQMLHWIRMHTFPGRSLPHALDAFWKGKNHR